MAAAAAEEVEVDIEGDEAELSQRNDNGTAPDFQQNRYLDSSWRNDDGFLQSWALDSSISEENRAAIEKMLQEEEYYLTGKNRSQNVWSDRPVKSIRQRKTVKSRTPLASSALSARWTPKEKELFEQGLAQFGRRWTMIAKLIESRTVLQVKSYARQYFKSKAKAEKPVEEGSTWQANIMYVSSNKANTSSTVPGSSRSSLSQGQACSTVKIEHMSDDEDVDVMDGTDSNDEDGLQEGKERGHGADSKRAPGEDYSPHCCSVSRADEPLSVPLVSAVTVQEFSPPSEPEEATKDRGPSGDNLEDVGGGTDCHELSPGKLSPADGVLDNYRRCEQPPEAAGEGLIAPVSDFLEFKSFEEKGSLHDNLLELGVCEMEADENGEDEEDEEEEALKPPAQEVILDKNVITEDEKQAISEFFEGRPSKTPERFLKIRNYILDQWGKCKPKYLNKTSVRPGLKNCGDVNCIGRIHTYLELIGAVNFSCEQAVYNRPRPVDRTRSKEEGKDCVQTYLLAQRLQSMRTRRRRVRDPWGNWRDARDLEGQTFEHLTAEELAKRREEEVNRSPRPARGPRQAKSSFDPFQLIPCHTFTDEKKKPFEVKVSAQVMLVMDMVDIKDPMTAGEDKGVFPVPMTIIPPDEISHRPQACFEYRATCKTAATFDYKNKALHLTHAHVSMAEVIGLLGGRYSSGDGVLEICVAEPCNSLSTGLQCEMDPVSQTQASETLAGRGYCIVGWYHSHPAFDPNPSLRDIDTQAKYQNYFSRGGAQFVGMIISPYNRSNALPYSQITCLVVSEELSPDGSYRLPYQCQLKEMNEEPPWVQIIDKARWIMEKYKLSLCNVPMLRIFRRDSNLTCLQKLLESMKKTLENRWNGAVVEEFLTQIEDVFLAGHREEDGDTGCKVVTAALPPTSPE